MIFGEGFVIKIGIIIGIIYGYFIDDSLLLNMEVLGVYFECNNCYVIESKNDDFFFFEGDFGLGVYVIDKDNRKLIKLLGIVFVFINWWMVVCNIRKIVD